MPSSSAVIQYVSVSGVLPRDCQLSPLLAFSVVVFTTPFIIPLNKVLQLKPARIALLPVTSDCPTSSTRMRSLWLGACRICLSDPFPARIRDFTELEEQVRMSRQSPYCSVFKIQLSTHGTRRQCMRAQAVAFPPSTRQTQVEFYTNDLESGC